MSTRRQTRRTTRVNRLSEGNDLPLSMEILDGSDEMQNISQNESNPSTPAPKRAANAMGDIESSAAKRQHSKTNTPNKLTSIAVSETVADSPRNTAPTVSFSNSCNVDTDTLKRWEAVTEKLTQVAPLIGFNANPAATPSRSQVVKPSVTEISTEELCNEVLQRLQAASNQSEAEKRQIAQERGQSALNALTEVMSKMREDPRAQQYLQDVQSGRVNDPEYGPARSAERAQRRYNPDDNEIAALIEAKRREQTALSASKTSGITAENSKSASNASHASTSQASSSAAHDADNHAETSSVNRERSDCSRLLCPTVGISPEDREHNDSIARELYAEILAAKNERLARQRTRSPQRKRHRRDSDEDGNDADKIIIPKFDGKDWPAFKSVFESVALHKKWSPAFKALQLKCQITGAARAALGVINASENWTYEQLVEHFELRHGRNQTKVEVMVALDKMYRKPTQSLTSWRDEVITVANTGRSLTAKQYRELTHYTFLRGLGTFPQMMNWVSERDSEETLESCYEMAKRYEREVGTPGVAVTRPSRVAAVSTATEVEIKDETAETNTVASHQTLSTVAPNPALERVVNDAALSQVIKSNQETSELIEKLTKELAQVKKRNNFKWRGGRGGRGRGGRGRGGFAFGQRYQSNGNQEQSNNSDESGAGRKTDGAAAPVQSE